MSLARGCTIAVLLTSGWACDSLALPMSDEEQLALAYGDRDTVSIATGSKQSLRRAPAVATVITAADIKAMGATSLDDVMETVPGVHVTRSYQSYFSIYTIRGIGNTQTTNPQVLMLQNGIPTNSLYRGDRGQAIGAPLLENIERIEIIRGPGSALYGADAFSGVINIITKSAATAKGTELGGRAGSFNSQNAWVQHGSQYGALDVAAYLQAGRADGSNQTVAADAATRLNRAFGGTSSYAPGPMNTSDEVIDSQLDLGYGKWRWRSGYKQRYAGLGVGASSALDPIGREKGERINTDLSWNDAEFSKNWALGFTGSYLHYTEDMTYQMFPPGTVLPTGTFTSGMVGMPGRKEQQFRLSGNATYSGFLDHSLRLGAGHEDLDMYQIRTLKNFLLNAAGVPIPTGPVIDYSGIQPHLLPHRRFNDYVYIQDEWNFTRDWALTAGLRNDNFSDFGSTTNPRLALVWDTTYDLTTKLLYGEAFHAPTFNDQYGVNPSADGNPNIRPERIKTIEAAFSWQARTDTKFNLNLFRYIMSDAIRPVSKTGGVGLQYQNTGQLHGSGAEVEMELDATHNVRVTANLALQESIDESTNADAGYAPRKHAFARGDWRIADNWTLSPQVNWVADRRRIPGDTRPQVPDYSTVDLTLHNTYANGVWDFTASVRNLFAATALEPTLYTAAPANVPTYPTGSIPYDLPVAPRTLWLQAEHKL